MNWKLKSALRKTVLAAPGGAGLYRFLTSRVLGTQHGMAAKWFRVAPAHWKVLHAAFGEEARQVPLWCFDSGSTPAAAFTNTLLTDVGGLLTDRHDRLVDRDLPTSRAVLAEKGGELALLAGAPAGRMEEMTGKLAACRNSREAIGALGMTYSGGHAVVDGPEWQGRVGMIFSAGAFEHYTPEEVEVELARMVRALRPGGVLSHVVDHRDHRWHADKTLSPLDHLTLAPEEYRRRFGNALDYHNRWMRSQWIRAMERHGLRVDARVKHDYSADLVPLDRSRLAEEFRDLPESDLNALVSHFVAVKPR